MPLTTVIPSVGPAVMTGPVTSMAAPPPQPLINFATELSPLHSLSMVSVTAAEMREQGVVPRTLSATSSFPPPRSSLAPQPALATALNQKQT
eukprot:CAMPEP_0201538762 /NCGR_PEP_ID=MMETSP0161_2-20130828/68521_1 /ASSEMBLY_ACC=CAM_ASM_000251 /TAXON_ID=180227 /ORGANISM="Neoparamoeba aestuarina, Strain SoJaBio B1-5/56/2" /LENGTH=91 /DNA_ID=CAMNT_0047945791 /DNA_START=84 /DNA_END=355 /DNA_ORIENTATION=+